MLSSKREGPTRHAHARARSADSIPPRSLQHPDFIDKNSSLKLSFVEAFVR
jgi:hypothetical protein